MIALLLMATMAVAPDDSEAAISNGDLLALAESEYRAGIDARADAAKARPHFAKAAAAYERLWRNGHRSAGLARHLAQAYLLAGDLPQAIRAYHLGMRLVPHDSDLQAGISYAREQVRYPMTGNLSEIGRYRDRNSILRYAPAWFYGLMAIAIYSLALLSLARGWMSRRPIWWVTGGVLGVLAMLTTAAALWENKHIADDNALSLVVVKGDGTMLHRGNGTEFPIRLTERLPEGVEMLVLTERGGWLQVQLAGGVVGWVDARRVVRVE